MPKRNNIKNLTKRRDFLNLIGLDTRIDSIISAFRLVPKNKDTLRGLFQDKVVKEILYFFEKLNINDLWCIAVLNLIDCAECDILMILQLLYIILVTTQ